jgi:hypothetical protein
MFSIFVPYQILSKKSPFLFSLKQCNQVLSCRTENELTADRCEINHLWPSERGGGGDGGHGQAHQRIQPGDEGSQVDHEVRVAAGHAYHLAHNGRLLNLVFLREVRILVVLKIMNRLWNIVERKGDTKCKKL